jgi:hypothetical protein
MHANAEELFRFVARDLPPDARPVRDPAEVGNDGSPRDD